MESNNSGQSPGNGLAALVFLIASLHALVKELRDLVADLKRNDRREQNLLTYKDAARLLGCSQRKVMRHVQSGELPAIDLDGSTRIHPKALDAFLHTKVRAGYRRGGRS